MDQEKETTPPSQLPEATHPEGLGQWPRVTPYVERRPEGDGETHLCDANGEFVGESQAHLVVDGDVWCVPCAENADLA